jgi:hypothetical protein
LIAACSTSPQHDEPVEKLRELYRSNRHFRRMIDAKGKQGTGEGRRRAMANGVKFGRKPKLSPYQRAEAIKRRAAGETLAIDRAELRGRSLDDFEVVMEPIIE